jgi:hypothetical protein
LCDRRAIVAYTGDKTETGDEDLGHESLCFMLPEKVN